MADIGGFIWAGLAGGGLSAALLAIAVVLGKSQLAHWLNQDIEAIKAKHQQDLETYKVSLIAEAERAKAAQDVKKAMAVQMANKRFAAIDRLHLSSSDIHLKISAFMGMAHALTPERYNETYNTLRSDCVALAAATAVASPFLSPKEKTILDTFSRELTDGLVAAYSRPDSRIPPLEGAQRCGAIFKAHEEAHQVVKHHLDQMMAMVG